MSPHGPLPLPAGPERRPRRPVREPRFTESVSVVLPAYNEQECIEDQVADCLEFLPRCFERYEVVCVDDGSRDRTAELIRGLERAHPGLVRGVYFERNRGYGAAIVAGFRAARGDLLFFTDSDRQFDVSELEAAVETLHEKGVSAVFGFRVYRYDSVLRCITSWVYNRLVRVLFGVRVRDVDCAFKLFERRVIDGMEVACTDFFIDTELVARTAKQGFASTELGVRHFPRTAGRTTVHPGHVPRTLLTVARMWLLIHFGIGKGRTIERDPRPQVEPLTAVARPLPSDEAPEPRTAVLRPVPRAAEGADDEFATRTFDDPDEGLRERPDSPARRAEE